MLVSFVDIIFLTIVGIVFVTFADIVLVSFVDTLLVAFTGSSQKISKKSISITFWMFTITTNTCARIRTITFFLHLQDVLHSHWHLSLFHFWFAFHYFEFVIKVTLNMFYQCFCCICCCYHIKKFNIYLFCFTENSSFHR